MNTCLEYILLTKWTASPLQDREHLFLSGDVTEQGRTVLMKQQEERQSLCKGHRMLFVCHRDVQIVCFEVKWVERD